MGKVSRDLEEKIAKTVKGSTVEVIVELPKRLPLASNPAGSDRAARIAALKKDFSVSAEPVEQAIERSGGTVLGRVFLNQSLKARLPREAIAALSERDDVALVDAARLIKTD